MCVSYRHTKSIGTWQIILQFLAFSAIITNAGLISFTSNNTDIYHNDTRVWIFISFISLIFIMTKIYILWFPLTSHEINVQFKRQKFINSKLFLNTTDDNAWKVPGVNQTYIVDSDDYRSVDFTDLMPY